MTECKGTDGYCMEDARDLMKALVRSVLFHRPDDVFDFMSDYFGEMPRLTQNVAVAIVGPHTTTKWLVIDTLIRASGGALVRVPVRTSKEIAACVREGAIPGVDFIFERRDIIAQRIASKSSASGDVTIIHGEGQTLIPWLISQSSIDDILQTSRIPLITDMETLEQAFTARSKLEGHCQLIICFISPLEPGGLSLEHDWTCANVGRSVLSSVVSYSKVTPTMSKIFRLIDQLKQKLIKKPKSSNSDSTDDDAVVVTAISHPLVDASSDIKEEEEVGVDGLDVIIVKKDDDDDDKIRHGIFHNVSIQANQKDLIHMISLQSIINLNALVNDVDEEEEEDDEVKSLAAATDTTSPPVPPPLPSKSASKSRFVKAAASTSSSSSSTTGLVCWPRLACSRVRQLLTSTDLPQVALSELSNILEAIFSHLLEYSSYLAGLHAKRNLID